MTLKPSHPCWRIFNRWHIVLAAVWLLCVALAVFLGGPGRLPDPGPFAIYLNCKVAILSALSIVNQGSPLAATVIPKGRCP